MEWLVELMTTFIFLLVKPFSLIKQSVSFGVRTLCAVVLTWMELLWNAICLHFSIFWKLISWIVAILSLPMRVLNALQNERLLKMYIRQMEIEIENLVWDKKGLEKQLRVAIKEHKMMALMLRELEDEHDEATAKIEQLEDELKGLKEENQQLKESIGKTRWSQREQIDALNLHKDHNQGPNTKESAATLSRRPSRAKTARKRQEIAWEDENKTTIEAKVDDTNKPAGLDDTTYVQYQIRETAVSRTLFSAVLSVVVGTTVWTAEDPCVPLILALFTVVAISLRSVVRFFGTIKNNPAPEAVALLSFNWFILGTLTYPTLPKVGHMLSPLLAHNFSDRTMRFLFGLFA